VYRLLKVGLTAALTLAVPVSGQQHEAPGSVTASSSKPATEAVPAPADRILRSISDAELRLLAAETLERNPGVARAEALARAAEVRALRVRGLPDPVLGATAWLQGAETRTGPQVLTLSWVQALPWLGKLELQEQVTLLEASALRAEVEVARLELVTAVRRLYYELAFLARHKEITQDFLDHLLQHEEISQSRYATGIGASLDVVKIQAEVTMAENLLLDIDRRRVELESKLNRLRDRPASVAILPAVLPEGEEIRPDYSQLLEIAGRYRPEIAAIDARIAASEARYELAEKEYRPNFNVGLTYTVVDRRSDPAGELNPPDGNGEDIVGIQGAMSVPVWRKKLKAGSSEARELESATRAVKRDILAGIRASISDLLQRLPLTWQQLRLLQDILILQAEQSVKSAESGYISGNFNALDLLDAEHVLFEAETAVARSLADYAIRLTELEGAVAAPLEPSTNTESSKS
jgi:cobalt-zinc-cadmium efflux system outer membrane protein